MNQQWKHLISTANGHFSSQAYHSALSLYQKALSLLETDWSIHLRQHPDNALAAMMVTHFNLADTWQALDQAEQACIQFEQACSFIHQLIERPGLSESIRHSAIRAAGRLDMEWACCVKQHSRSLSEQHKRHYANAHLALEQISYRQMH